MTIYHARKMQTNAEVALAKLEACIKTLPTEIQANEDVTNMLYSCKNIIVEMRDFIDSISIDGTPTGPRI